MAKYVNIYQSHHVQQILKRLKMSQSKVIITSVEYKSVHVVSKLNYSYHRITICSMNKCPKHRINQKMVETLGFVIEASLL